MIKNLKMIARWYSGWNIGLRVRRYEFRSCFQHLLALKPWANHLTSLGLSFLIYKMEIITVPTLQGDGEDQMK